MSDFDALTRQIQDAAVRAREEYLAQQLDNYGIDPTRVVAATREPRVKMRWCRNCEQRLLLPLWFSAAAGDHLILLERSEWHRLAAWLGLDVESVSFFASIRLITCSDYAAIIDIEKETV